MNELQIFENSEFGSVRTVKVDGKIYFMANDIAKALGYSDCPKAVRTHCKGVAEIATPTAGGVQNVKFIPEGDIYRLVIKSQLPTAEKFERWIFDEVLPSIRKHGMYAEDELLDNPDLLISVAQKLKEERERNKALKAENERMKPKEVFADAVTASKASIFVGELAKILKQNGYKTGEK